MGHSLQMNILRTGQTEVGDSMMNQVKQQSWWKQWGRRNWWWIQEWRPDSEDDSMVSFVLLSPQTRNICRRAASYNTLRTSSNKRSWSWLLILLSEDYLKQLSGPESWRVIQFSNYTPPNPTSPPYPMKNKRSLRKQQSNVLNVQELFLALASFSRRHWNHSSFSKTHLRKRRAMSHVTIASIVRRIATLKLLVYVKTWYILDWIIEVPHYSCGTSAWQICTRVTPSYFYFSTRSALDTPEFSYHIAIVWYWILANL